MTGREHPIVSSAPGRDASDDLGEMVRRAIEVQWGGAKLPTTSTPFIRHGRIVASDPDSRCSRIYWTTDPPLAIDFSDETARQPNRRERYRHREALAKARGWRYVLLPGEWAIPEPGDEIGALPTTPRTGDPYRAEFGDFG